MRRCSRSPLARFAALIALAVLLAACGSNNNKNNTNTTNTNTANVAAPSAASTAATTAVVGTPGAAAASTAAPGAFGGTPVGSPVALGDPKAAALAAAGGKKLGGSVTVMGSWGGAEQDSFMAEVKPFEDATGVQVQYTGTRDLSAQLTTAVQGGNPPDLAGLPDPGTMQVFANQGKLIDLSTVLDMNTMQQEYPAAWLQLAQVNGKQVGIFIKAALKGTIWYDPKTFNSVDGGQTPKTLDDLQNLVNKIQQSGTTPWCAGFEAGATTGWPGTDWLEDIVLRQDGPAFYQQWYQGKVKWSSPQIKQAWQTWGQLTNNFKDVFGGSATILSTNFGDEGNPMFTTPPKCYMVHEGTFITDFFTNANKGIKAGSDFNFFMFPDINQQYTNSAEIAGDLFGMFKNTPQAQALMRYLTTPEAQAIWVSRGGALSPNLRVTPNVYPDDLSREQAQILSTTKNVVFDASDQMPPAMQSAFYKAVLDYVQNPGNLDSILSTLDQAQASAYPQQ